MALNMLSRLMRHPSFLLAVLVWLLWLGAMYLRDTWHLLDEYAFVSLTMAFASFIAGATSEGGGAVAFPVLTIFFGIDPIIARDFSLAIQGVGMTAAAFSILISRIPIEKRALAYASLGGIPGIMIGLYGISPFLSPIHTKMFFVSLWLSFGVVVLYRHLFSTNASKTGIRQYTTSIKRQLFVLGIVGGIVTGITGSGIDIVVFSYLVLQHRINIRIATATSVVLMAGNALVGIAMRMADHQSVDAVTWHYWMVAIPIVVVGAPLGAQFIARQSFRVVAVLLCSTILAQFLGAILIVPQSPDSLLLSTLTFGIGFMLFSGFFNRILAKKCAE